MTSLWWGGSRFLQLGNLARVLVVARMLIVAIAITFAAVTHVSAEDRTVADCQKSYEIWIEHYRGFLTCMRPNSPEYNLVFGLLIDEAGKGLKQCKQRVCKEKWSRGCPGIDPSSLKKRSPRGLIDGSGLLREQRLKADPCGSAQKPCLPKLPPTSSRILAPGLLDGDASPFGSSRPSPLGSGVSAPPPTQRGGATGLR